MKKAGIILFWIFIISLSISFSQNNLEEIREKLAPCIYFGTSTPPQGYQSPRQQQETPITPPITAAVVSDNSPEILVQTINGVLVIRSLDNAIQQGDLISLPPATVSNIDHNGIVEFKIGEKTFYVDLPYTQPYYDPNSGRNYPGSFNLPQECRKADPFSDDFNDLNCEQIFQQTGGCPEGCNYQVSTAPETRSFGLFPGCESLSQKQQASSKSSAQKTTCTEPEEEQQNQADTSDQTSQTNTQDQNVLCGDASVDLFVGEECDDGNLENEDGCSEFCKIEKDQNSETLTTWSCQRVGGPCTQTCGDNNVNGKDECEPNSDQSAMEACDQNCRIKDGYECETQKDPRSGKDVSICKKSEQQEAEEPSENKPFACPSDRKTCGPYDGKVWCCFQNKPLYPYSACPGDDRPSMSEGRRVIISIFTLGILTPPKDSSAPAYSQQNVGMCYRTWAEWNIPGTANYYNEAKKSDMIGNAP